MTPIGRIRATVSSFFRFFFVFPDHRLKLLSLYDWKKTQTLALTALRQGI
jgi:hypothetical protein